MKDEDKSKKQLIQEVKKLRRQLQKVKSPKGDVIVSNESSEDLKSIINSFDGFLYITSEKYEVRFINDTLKNFIGNDAVGRKCYSSIYGYKNPCKWCPIDKIKNGESIKCDFQNPKNNRWYSVINSPVSLQNGEILMQGVAIDITDYKDKEKEMEIYRDQLEEIIKERTGGLIAMNEMLKKEIADRKEREKELRFKDLAIKSTVNAIVFADMKGTLTYANDFFNIMWGFHHIDEVVGKNFADLWNNTKNGEALLELLHKKGNWMGEIQARSNDGSTFYTLVSATIVKDEYNEDSRIMTSIVDISERIKAEKAILDSEERIRKVIHDMPVLMDAFDKNGNIMVWNRECERVTGYTTDEILGNENAVKLLYPDDQYREHLMELWQEKENYFRDWEMKLTCKDGTERTVLWSNISRKSPIPGWDSWAVGIDITDRKQLEKEILDISERERIRLGHDLHDGIGQYFTGLGYLTKVLKNKLTERSFDDKGIIIEIMGLIDEAKTHIRSLAKGLSPVNIDEHGITAAVKDLSMYIEKVFSISCTFNYNDDFAIENNSIATHVYYIIQESINNAIKHGEATILKIKMKQVNREFKITIEDNGKGFNEELIEKRGMGIDLMRYRTDIIGGTLDFSRSTKGGAMVALRFVYFENN